MLPLYLEICRGVAALWVFLFHCPQLYAQSMPWLLPLGEYGHLGVPMFFVISGYVITHSAESNRRKGLGPIDFFRRRFRRIYPAFWASVAIVVAFPFLLEMFSSLKTGRYFAPQLTYTDLTAFDWVGLLTLLRVFEEASSLQALFAPVNSVYWTLAIEFQFYVVISALLFLKTRYHRALFALSVLALAVAVSGPLLGIHGLFLGFWPAFSFGMAVAYLHRAGRFYDQKKTKQRLVIAASIGITVTSVIVFFPQTEYRQSTVFALCFALFVWFTAGFEDWLARAQTRRSLTAILLIKPLLTLGAMSYSVYLLHAKLFQLPEMIARQVTHPSSPLYAACTIVGTLIISYCMYYFVERRFMSSGYQQLHAKLTA